MPRRSYKKTRSRNTRSRYTKRRNVGRMSKRVRRRGGGNTDQMSIRKKFVYGMKAQFTKSKTKNQEKKPELSIFTNDVSGMIKQYTQSNPNNYRKIETILRNGFDGYKDNGDTSAIPELREGLLQYYNKKHNCEQFKNYKTLVDAHQSDVIMDEIDRTCKDLLADVPPPNI